MWKSIPLPSWYSPREYKKVSTPHFIRHFSTTSLTPSPSAHLESNSQPNLIRFTSSFEPTKASTYPTKETRFGASLVGSYSTPGVLFSLWRLNRGLDLSLCFVAMFTMDKSWMQENFRFSTKYMMGVRTFMSFAKENMGQDNVIKCPYVECLNMDSWDIDMVESHLILNGISKSYTRWIDHGELPETTTSTSDLYNSSVHDGRYNNISMEIDDDEEGDRIPELIDDVPMRASV